MEKLRLLIGEKTFDKAVTFIFFAIIVALLAPMFNLVLLTFLFSFLFFNAQDFIQNKVTFFAKINDTLITVFVYATFGLVLFLLGTEYIPQAIDQLKIIVQKSMEFDPSIFRKYIPNEILQSLLSEINFKDWIRESGRSVLEAIKEAGSFLMEAFLAFILSFFLLLEKNEIIKFGRQFQKSKLGFLSEDLIYFGSNFVNSFGRVMQLQIIISTVNTVLSYFVLVFLGFPEVLGLSFMIFILGLIPVAGVAISFIPLSIIAYNLGGLGKVLAVIAMIIGLHGLESYVLNPKLMSIKTKLPVFFVFSILIFSEHTFGPWGLLIGLPLFIFIMDILDIKPAPEEKKKHFIWF